MSNQSLYTIFCLKKPSFERQLEAISDIQVKNKFKRGFRNEKDRINFLSRLSEFWFYNFFISEELKCQYEPKVKGKLPDFKLSFLDFDEVYCDVKRFNLPDSDRFMKNRISKLQSKLRTLIIPIRIRIITLDNVDFKINNAFLEIKEWLQNQDISLGDEYEYRFNGVRVLIIRIDMFTNNNKLEFTALKSLTPRINPLKLKSDILAKISTYKEISPNTPFFVALDLIFGTLYDVDDYRQFFLASSYYDIDDGTTGVIKGEFFSDRNLNFLTGILIRYTNEYYWISNPMNAFQLRFNNAIDVSKNYFNKENISL